MTANTNCIEVPEGTGAGVKLGAEHAAQREAYRAHTLELPITIDLVGIKHPALTMDFAVQ